MFLVLELKLLGALLAGMLVYQLVHMIAPFIEKRMTSGRARLVAVVILSAVIIGGLTGATHRHHRAFRARRAERAEAARPVDDDQLARAPARAGLGGELSARRRRPDEGQGDRADAHARRAAAARRQGDGARLRAYPDRHDHRRDHRGRRAEASASAAAFHGARHARDALCRRVPPHRVRADQDFGDQRRLHRDVPADRAADLSRAAAALEDARAGHVHRRLAAGDRQSDLEHDHRRGFRCRCRSARRSRRSCS